MAETKDAPVLVKKDGERVPAVAKEDAFARLADVMEAIAGKFQASEARDGQLAQSLLEVKADLNKGDYNLANFPGRSVFNPAGEKLHPRGQIVGEVMWAGMPMDEREMTPFEIDLANQIVPGIYNGGDWQVIDRSPGQIGSRNLLVVFPCKDADMRSRLPQEYWDSTYRGDYASTHPRTGQPGRWVTGMERMLRQMVEEAASRQAVSA